MKRILVAKGLFIIQFKCDDFTATLKQVQSLQDRVFNKDGRYWHAPATDGNRAILTAAGFEFTARAKPIDSFEKLPVNVPSRRIIELKMQLPELRTYQLEGVEFLEKNHGGLIGDEMGTGKSCQSLSFLKMHPEKLPALIICPATLKYQWRDEILKWYGKASIAILEGMHGALQNFADFTIINYDILEGWELPLAAFPFKTVIGDEIQYIQNSDAKRTTAFKYIVTELKPVFIPMSGTPIKSRTAQFFNCLHLLAPRIFPNEYRFLHRYCDPKIEDVWTKRNGKAVCKKVRTYKGSSNWEELHGIIKKLMIRREKADVLKELPPKQKIIIPLPANKTEYAKYLDEENNFREWALREKTADKNKKKLAIEHLKQAAYLAKRAAVIEWIKDFISTGRKFVVFAIHTQAVLDLYKSFPGEAVMIDGSVKDRETPVKQFWDNPKIKLFVGQIEAAGVGLNLQCAGAMGIVEFPWTPATSEQAEDRINRMGQKSSSIECYYFVAERTVDLHICNMLVDKNKTIKRLLTGREDEQFFGEQEILEQLFEKYKIKGDGK